ncbi:MULTISPECIES: RNA 2',3'-cyclic phosphodiesterase [unclassified Lentilitoribacter]|jgi:2'-5' RNA ligase|uniref:RNA 2',3'-cyclic phosphodiesterase n=1 Tax=unclassified Lentilitoribacter TaxID=2647570 RepID=UPI0013A6F3B0|nr:RNA 2',3'-cyclic phosphodiesterase [Lentilitoribacter sp. Alg239-R112]
MPRLFVALQIPHEVALSLSLLRGGLMGARWIDVENYHLTLRFIGDVDGRTGDELLSELDRISSPEFDLGLSGVNAFGSKRKVRSLWAGTNNPPEIFDLQAAIERICARIGIAPDSRKFTPHVTLARLRRADPVQISEYLGGRANFKSNSFKVAKFVVMSSRSSKGGGPYVVEESYLLNPTYYDFSLPSEDIQASRSIL